MSITKATSNVIAPILATGSTTSRSLPDRFADVVNVRDFGAVGDGVTDDTIAIINAFESCRTNNKILVIDGTFVFNATTVPSGKKHSGQGGDYVYASSIIAFNPAELLVNGKIGFDTAGVNNTVIQGFTITTTGRQIGESGNVFNDCPILLASNSGTKDSAIYRDLIIYNTVTDLTGAYRSNYSLNDTSCASILIDNVQFSNNAISVYLASCSNIVIRNIFSFNIEVGIFLNTSATNYQISNIHHINTKQQADYWVGRTASPTPRGIAGMDGIILEGGNNGTVSGLNVVWAHERAIYLQTDNVNVFDCMALNCDGYKIVGTIGSTIRKNANIDNCHLKIDDNWASTRGRTYVNLGITYWYDGITFQGCSLINTQDTATMVFSTFSLGTTDGSTTQNVYIKDCFAINATRFALGFLTSVASPTSYISLRNLTIEDCYIKKAPLRVYGSLFDNYLDVATSAALATYATENVKLLNNLIDLSITTQDDFIFTRYCVNGLISRNTTVNIPFINNGFFIANIASPYQNIVIEENGLWTYADAGTLTNQLQYLTVFDGSSISFKYINSSVTYSYTLTNSMYNSGTLATGRTIINIYGTGYAEINNTASFGIEMKSSGNFYFGKRVGATITNQVSTPPITLSANVNTIAIDGTSTPTVLWNCNFTKV